MGPRGRWIFFLTCTRWLPMYENQNPATISRQKCYQMYLWLFQTSKMNFLPNDAIFYWSVPKVAYWWVEQHIKRSVSAPQPLQSYRMMKFHLGSKHCFCIRILVWNFFIYNIYPILTQKKIFRASRCIFQKKAKKEPKIIKKSQNRHIDNMVLILKRISSQWQIWHFFPIMTFLGS